MYKLERQYLQRMAANPYAQQLCRAPHKDQIMTEVSEIKAADHVEDVRGMVMPERDLFIAANPVGASAAELEKDRRGFVDDRTHADYLIFLAGYRAAQEQGQ